jgi:probable F420-dependent oxidoreductase
MLSFGLVLSTLRSGATAELIEAGAETAERLGWDAVWATDHVLVPRAAAVEYGRIYEAITTLAWVGARHPTIRLGTSVIVVPQRNAVVLAKELATLDALSEGRVLAGVGVGWNEAEFENLGAGERLHQRGAYLDETIRLWRHLWSGSEASFEGQFHAIDDFAFEPLPAQGADLPIVVGGRAPAALRRAGALGDWYQSSGTGPAAYADRIEPIRRAAAAAGRSMPALSARITVRFGEGEEREGLLGGDADAILEGIREFEALEVEHLAVAFGAREPAELIETIQRFDAEVIAAVRG